MKNQENEPQLFLIFILRFLIFCMEYVIMEKNECVVKK